MFDIQGRMDRILQFVDEQIPQLVKANGIPGLSISFIHGNETIWQNGYGTTCFTGGAPVTADTMFSLQSISKTYTAFGFLMAVDRGLVSLDDRLVEVVPEFSVESRWGKEQGSLITFRHLLSHRSGLLHEAPVGNNYGVWNNTFEEHARSISGTWLKFPPGQGYSYSNLGIDMAAYALERLTGRSFEVYMKEELFDPLGMARTTFDQAKAMAEPDFASGHIGERFVSRRIIPMVASGGLYSTASDLARFVAFMMSGAVCDGRKFISGELLLEMQRPQFVPEGQKTGYALGVDIQTHGGYSVVNHCGGGYGYLTVQEWIPEMKAGVVVLTNSATHNSAHMHISRTAFDLMNLLLNNPPGEDKPEWAGYAGLYSSPLYIDIDPVYQTVSVIDGCLFLNNARLREYTPGVFFTEDGTSVEFGDGSMIFANVAYTKEKDK